MKVVTEDIESFEYTPKPQYPGPFEAFNEATEEALLKKFLTHIQELQPHVVVTYNGDRFDWPYVEARCKLYKGLSLYYHLGIKGLADKDKPGSRKSNRTGEEGDGGDGEGETKDTAVMFADNEYTGRGLVHLDAYRWVARDSYLPQGSQGLKAVTKFKLGYVSVQV